MKKLCVVILICFCCISCSTVSTSVVSWRCHWHSDDYVRLAFDIEGNDPSLTRIPETEKGIRLGFHTADMSDVTVIPACRDIELVVQEDYIDVMFTKNIVSLVTGHGATKKTWFVDVNF